MGAEPDLLWMKAERSRRFRCAHEVIGEELHLLRQPLTHDRRQGTGTQMFDPSKTG